MNENEPPARNGRFQKGVCPNPAGRPRKTRSVSAAILKAANETVTANENGKKRRMRKIEATAAQVANKGMQGDLRAGKMLIDYVAKAEEEKAAADNQDTALTQSDLEIAARVVDRVVFVMFGKREPRAVATKVPPNPEIQGDSV